MTTFSESLLKRIKPAVLPNVRMDEPMLRDFHAETLGTMEAPFCGLGGCGAPVVVFGSARKDSESPEYRDARMLGAGLTERDLTGKSGGGPGIMEALNRGIREAGGVSVGLGIILPREQDMNPYMDVGREFKYFAPRKIGLTKEVVAVVAYAGGFGTLDELFEVLNLQSKGKMPAVPVILVGESFWGPIVGFLWQNCGPGKPFKSQDLNRIKVVSDHTGVLREIDLFRKQSPASFKKTGAIDYVMAERMAEETRAAMTQLTTQGGPYVHVSGSRTNVQRGFLPEARELGRLIGENGYLSLTNERTRITENLHASVVNRRGHTAGFYDPRLPESAIDPNLQLRIATNFEFIGPVLAHKYAIGSVNFPGAFGTLEGVFEQATLVQCKKVPARPIVCIGSHFFGPLKDVLEKVMWQEHRTIDREDLELLQVTDSPSDAWEILHSYAMSS